MTRSTRPRRRGGFTALIVTTMLVLLSAAGVARGADSVYWVNFAASKISHANQGGGGGGDIPIPTTAIDGPYGMAIDAAAGKVFWSNFDGSTIGVANLDGSGSGLLNTAGTTVSEPAGLAIDPAGGRVYWANSAANTISFANLNGSGGGDLNTTGATVKEPFGVAIDPASGRIYWANYETDSISFAKLDGSGGGDLDTTGAPINGPDGVAIDAASGRIFWANFDTGTIGFASLSGGGGGQLDTTGAVIEDPAGLAIDPIANRIYWGSDGNDTIGFAGLSGGGGGQLDTTGATTDHVAYPVLLKAPSNVQPPAIEARPIIVPRIARLSTQGRSPSRLLLPDRGIPSHSKRLSCSQGSWAGDLVESFLYRAEQSFSYQWLRNDQPVAGATDAKLQARQVGSYACQVTATNFAGATLQTSAPYAISAAVRLGRVTRNLDRGTATLGISTSGDGSVELTGKAVFRQRRRINSRISPKRPGVRRTTATAVTIRAKGKARRKLNKTGKVKVRVKVAYTPEGGEGLVRTRTILLRKRLGAQK